VNRDRLLLVKSMNTFATIAAAIGMVPPMALSQAPMPDAPAIVRAARANQRPVIDGRESDQVWKSIQPTAGFRQYYPQEDGTPTVLSEFKVAYDDRNLYVFVRAFDPHPDSIMHALTRRDNASPSDIIGLTIDGYHDRRTGVEFAVNPDGVKKDCAVYADTLFDWSWDGVWDAATRVDSLGWTAEFRIPFSQFRYANAQAHTFGFAVWRTSYRHYESSIWPRWRISRGGLISQLGELVGIENIASPHSVAVTPYTVATNMSRRSATGYDRAQLGTVGGDLKYAVGPNLTLDATVNPDFGQVEADPSVLNLTAAETFYPEKRPFFLEGGRQYEFMLGCNTSVCANEGLFYSRRIGRAPQLLNLYGDASSRAATPIATAVKLTGRTGGLSLGVLDAVTEQVGGAADRTIEPRTNYAVLRAVEELAGGRTAFGVMATDVDRVLDPLTESLLRRRAYAGATDFRQRFGRDLELTGSLTGTLVEGSASAIAATQRSSTHYYQRPDAGLSFDSTRRSLSGDAEELSFGKYGGTVQFQTAWQRHSAGLEVNDVGFMQRADLQSLTTGATVNILTPHSIFKIVKVSTGWFKTWNTEWLQLTNGVSADAYTLLTSNWSVEAAMNLPRFPGTFCDDCARGGPAYRLDFQTSPSLVISGDSRRRMVPSLALSETRTSGGRQHIATVNPSLAVNVATRFQASVGALIYRNHDNTQWYGNFTDAANVTHYSFALLEQRTLAFTMRASFAATPNLTLESYAAPFVSTGTYSNVRELSATPRAAGYDSRFLPYVPPPGSASGFDVRQLRSNLVGRWEYRPGSTLFVVWTHGRDGSDSANPDRPWGAEYRSLFTLHPDNTFLVKMTYWLSR
jgi:Domain of unknown function (DUF5916)